MNGQTVQSSRPPDFVNARNSRQKSRAAGLDPDYWYAVEVDKLLPVNGVTEVIFWKKSIALFKDELGRVHAIENRCIHRGLKLSLGNVDGCNLQCAYHGWKYSGDGEVVEIPHDMFGGESPRAGLASYPVRQRYGLIWLFPGDPARAEQVQIPEIPELEGVKPWACEPISFTWKAHHSMIIDNVSDFTHAHLHRKYRPFSDSVLTQCETVGDDVFVHYNTRVGRGRISGLFVDHEAVDTNSMQLCFQYPYQWSNTDDHIKHYLFVLPIDERTTRSFFLFYFKSLKVPFTKIKIPHWLMQWILKISNKLLIIPLLKQDQFAVEAEQEAYEKLWQLPPIELNPAVQAFQSVINRKWQSCLDRQGSGSRTEVADH